MKPVSALSTADCVTGLARKAVSPAYIALQQEYARKTVEEFVAKWLRTQTQWQLERQPRLEVRFASE